MSTVDISDAELFYVAFKHRDRYDGGQRDALPWLYGIATNLLRRRSRQESTRYRALARAGLDVVSSDEPAQQAVDRTDAKGYMRLITTALARMPRRQRDVLLLYALADLDYQEIATALDIPIGTVRSVSFAARADALLTPAGRTALYQAIALLPGIERTPGQVDLAGRGGVAVGRTAEGVAADQRRAPRKMFPSVDR
jgi:RNA polymerase sigma factor (sigma-70 family)